MSVTLIALAAMLLLAFAGLPIVYAMVSVGFIGFAWVIGWAPSMALVGQTLGEAVMQESLSVLPLFVLMGNLCTRAGLSDDLYRFGNAFFGHRRGGLAMATVVACGGFGAICGSSLATAATMTKVALPSMRRYGYSDSLASASIAAGGTLGSMIPPSVIMVLYGLMTGTDIARLFVAGILPGLLGILLYMAAVYITVLFKPESGPRGERFSWAERLASVRRIGGTFTLFALVIGGLYAGVFTSTEGAAVGATGAFFLALWRRALTWRTLIDVLRDAALTTAKLFAILIGALILANLINAAMFPQLLESYLRGLNVSPLMMIIMIVGIYIVLGCVLESISMIMLTIPIFFPIVVAYGLDPIWFGVLVVLVVEIGMITPPMGMNIFVLVGVQGDVKPTTVMQGLVPFIAMDVVRIAILIALPGLVLFLPRMMG